MTTKRCQSNISIHRLCYGCCIAYIEYFNASMVYDAIIRLVGLYMRGLEEVRQYCYSDEHIHFINVDTERGSVECGLLCLASRLTPKTNLQAAVITNTQNVTSSS